LAVPKPSISAFFPCYNDAQTIGDLVTQADRVLGELTDDYEIIVVNDGSRDESASVLAALSQQVPRLRVVQHLMNRGYGAALRSGFEHATKELVFYTDGDGQYDVNEIPILVMLLTDDTHFVNGMKMTRQDPPHRVFIGNLHRFVTRWSFWLPISDVDCDFRLIRRSILGKIRLSSSSGSICVELVKQAQRAGAQFREVSIHHYARRSGVSEFFTARRILHTYADLAVMWIDLMIVAKLKGLRGLIESAA
jgi:glycosyltransferase involved in cell wall biosynthesis